MKFTLLILSSSLLLGVCKSIFPPWQELDPKNPIYRNLLDLAIEKQREIDPDQLKGATPVQTIDYVAIVEEYWIFKIIYFTRGKNGKVGQHCQAVFFYREEEPRVVEEPKFNCNILE